MKTKQLNTLFIKHEQKHVLCFHSFVIVFFIRGEGKTLQKSFNKSSLAVSRTFMQSFVFRGGLGLEWRAHDGVIFESDDLIISSLAICLRLAAHSTK